MYAHIKTVATEFRGSGRKVGILVSLWTCMLRARSFPELIACVLWEKMVSPWLNETPQWRLGVVMHNGHLLHRICWHVLYQTQTIWNFPPCHKDCTAFILGKTPQFKTLQGRGEKSGGFDVTCSHCTDSTGTMGCVFSLNPTSSRKVPSGKHTPALRSRWNSVSSCFGTLRDTTPLMKEPPPDPPPPHGSSRSTGCSPPRSPGRDSPEEDPASQF